MCKLNVVFLITSKQDKAKPKPMTAENAKMQSQRQGEKAANAAVAAGGNISKQKAIINKQNQQFNRGGNGGKSESTFIFMLFLPVIVMNDLHH